VNCLNNESIFFDDKNAIETDFSSVLKETQEYISSKYSTLLFENNEGKQIEQQIKAYLSKFILDNKYAVHNLTLAELVDKLYAEMAEFSFLTQYLFRKDVEEINLNNWKDVKITYTDGKIRPTKERFSSPEHAVNVIRRLLHKSGMILDYAQPFVIGHLSNNIRITVFGNPITDKDKGVAASIRIVNPQKLEKSKFIEYGTATEEMLDFLNLALRYGVSICITGSASKNMTLMTTP
jgi:pilus assembly protein CpaF